MEPLSTLSAATAMEGAKTAQEVANVEASLARNSVLESASEVREAIVGEKGLDGQIDVVRFESLDAVAARNGMAVKMRNAALDGLSHPETGVLFEKHAVELPNGRVIEGVFPKFEAVYETKLPDQLLKATSSRQTHYCNEQLRQAIERDPGLKENLSERQLQQIQEGTTPDGYTWHHHEEPGRMQLVDALVHMKTGHTGGREIWSQGW